MNSNITPELCDLDDVDQLKKEFKIIYDRLNTLHQKLTSDQR